MTLSKIFLFSTLTLACFSSPVMAEKITIETARDSVSLDSNPQKIAVFDIPAVDTLSALEVPISGTVEKMYVDYLDDVTNSAKVVGSLFEPDFKALSSMKPDLIVVGGRSSTTLESVSKIAPSIDMTIWGDNLIEQIRSRTTAYGRLFNKSAKAELLITEMDEAVAKAQKAAAGQGQALVIMTNGPKISAFGPGSRFGWLYQQLDLEAVTDDVSIENHGDAVSFEFLLKHDPDWLLILDRGAAIGSEGVDAKATLDNEIMHKTKAWKNKQMIYLNSADVYIANGGIQSQNRVMNDIADAFSAAK